MNIIFFIRNMIQVLKNISRVILDKFENSNGTHLRQICDYMEYFARYYQDFKGSSKVCEYVPNESLNDQIIISQLSGKESGIYVLSLNRPKAVNSLSREMVSNLQSSLDKLAKYDDLMVLIIRSAVPGIFCAGADLKERITISEDEVPGVVSDLGKVAHTIHDFPMPVIAAIDGVAAGGGFEYALAADIRIIASNARLGLVETTLAIIPGAGGTQRLPRLIPIHLAKELIFTGRLIDAQKAFQMGLANYLVEQNKRGCAAYLKAIELGKEMTKNGPLALKLSKSAINKGVDQNLRTGLTIESICYNMTLGTRDRREGLSAFKEKRLPAYIGQ